MHFTCNGTKSFQNNLCYKKTIWNRCCSPLGKDETDLILLTSYNGKNNIMCCINPLSLIFGITLVANEKTVPCFNLYKVWHKINIAEDLILVFVLNSTVTNLISGTKKKVQGQNSVSNYRNTGTILELWLVRLGLILLFWGILLKFPLFVCVGLVFF